MPAADALRRLTAAAPVLLSQTDSLVDAAEEDRILARILASPQPAERRPIARRPRVGLAVVGAAAVAAATAVVSGVLGHSTGGHHRLALSGAKIEVAGYHFRTPAGFKASRSACAPASNATPVRNGFVAAASADGGCVEAVALLGGSSSTVPAEAQPVAVGSYLGYYLLVQDGSDESTLYVELPHTGGHLAYLVLFATQLNEGQLVAVAESGLPTLPIRPTTTTG